LKNQPFSNAVKIQTKIILFLLLIFVLFLAGFISLRSTEENREEVLLSTRIHEKNTLFDKILKLEEASLEMFAYEFSYSDKIVRFVSGLDSIWPRAVIESVMASSNVQYIGIYSPEFTLVHSAGTIRDAGIADIALPPSVLKTIFSAHYFRHFYLSTSAAPIEIHTAPIHPVSDIFRETEPRGYLIAGRLWSKDYIDELSVLTESTITLSPISAGEKTFASSYRYDPASGSFGFSRMLPGWDWNPVMRIHVLSESSILKQFNALATTQLALFIIFAFVILVATSFFLVRWVSTPLKLISRSLEKGDPGVLNKMRIDKTEFGNLAQLIAMFFLQRVDLEKEVNERTRAEAALIEANQALTALIESAPLAIVSITSEHKIKSWNPAAERMFGWREQEVLGQPLPFVPANKQRDIQDMIERVLQGSSFTDFEICCTKKDGTPVDLTITSAPLCDASGSVGGIMTVILDITVNRQLIREIIEISSREQIRIGQDLHDGLSQHLTGIAFLSKALEQKLAAQSLAEAGPAREITQLVNQSIEMTRGLARGLSPVAVGEDGLMLSLRELAATVTSLFGISCLFHADGSAVNPGTATATHLFRIVQEAVNNAVKHGHARQIIISLSANHAKTVLKIEDDGVGLASPPERGKGMGLHIMSYRARMIGASLSVESMPSAGTTVTCVL
jgi:PAS domain S-box-containing protein